MKHLAAVATLVLAFIAVACVPAVPLTGTQGNPATLPPEAPTEFVPSPIPVTPTYEMCAYMWASQDMPELSRKLNASLQKLSSTDVTGLAYAYGEDCVYGDGHSTFSAMETDFRIGVTVTSVRDQDTMGGWIRKVMDIILAIPREQLQGPQPGRVDFDFKQPDPAEVFVTVPIDKYRAEADDLKGAALFQLFYTKP